MAQGADEMRLEWNKPVAPFQIVGNVYYVGMAGVSSFLIKTPAGAIVVDGALPESAPLIALNLRTLGVTMRDVKYLLNTHAHFDHAGGLAGLKKETGAAVVASAVDAADLEAGRSVDFGKHGDSPFPAVKVDRRIKDGETLELGGIKLTAHATPGHTRGCTSWTMRTDDAAGHPVEVIFHCSTSVPGYVLVKNAKYPTIVGDYRKTFERLGKMHADVFLAPHPFMFDLEEKRARMLAKPAPNPFVDPAELGRFNAGSQQDFEKALTEQQAAKSKPKR